ncbi:MAG: sugar phosphate nucleotidyltransferase [Kiritimatiellaeota bacterium]|nr:sugar phosphate nucleotidyltransferase [Kiritimatiellota bacterium]
MKAIIPAAGLGSRFYPVAKSVPKEMLPVGGKPAIQLIVEEALAAGAGEVIIVTSPQKPSIMQYFTPDPAWRARVEGKAEAVRALDELDRVSKSVRFVFQHEQLGLGHAVLQAAPACAGEKEPVLVLLGDALVKSDAPCARGLVEVSRAFGNASVVGLERVPPERVSRYGIAGGTPVRENLLRLDRLVEKPPPDAAPSDLAVAGRYVLDPRVFACLSACAAGHGGEIQLTDAIQRMLEGGAPVYGCRYPGTRFDIGNPDGYREVVLAYR